MPRQEEAELEVFLEELVVQVRAANVLYLLVLVLVQENVLYPLVLVLALVLVNVLYPHFGDR